MQAVRALLASTAVGLLVAGGAQAADLPVKAKPVEYVRICSLYGAGFFFVPGKPELGCGKKYAIGPMHPRFDEWCRLRPWLEGRIGSGACLDMLHAELAAYEDQLGELGRANGQ